MLPIVQNVPLPPGNVFGTSINSGAENVNARDLPVTIVPKPADAIKAENDLRGKSPFFENKALDNEIKKKNQNFVNNSIKTIASSLDYLEGIDVEGEDTSAEPKTSNVGENSVENINEAIDVNEAREGISASEESEEENSDAGHNIPEIKFQQASKIFETIIGLSPSQGDSGEGVYRPNSIIV